MAKIILCYPAWTGEAGLFGWFAKRNSRWPPLNLALLGAIAEEAGHEVFILDAEVNGWDNIRLAKETIALKPDIVGLTAYSPFFHLSCDTAREIKRAEPDLPILIGGPHITIMRQEAHRPYFDYLFTGEAERSLPRFLAAFPDRSKIEKIGGLIYRDGDDIKDTGPAQWLTERSTKGSDVGQFYPLDDLPLPARHLLPMHKYRLGTLSGRKHFSSIQSFRGCPWTCVFCCSDKLNTTRVIMKSPERVVEEMVDTVTRWPFIDHFYIVDDVLTLWPKHVTEIVDRMDAAGLQVTFEGSTRANLVSDALIARLAKSGLVRLSFGLETVDPVMRVTMQKKVGLDAYQESNRICNRYGVEALNSLMIGLPGETPDTIKATIEWVREQRDISQANVAIAVPYPGTEFSDMAISGAHGVELLSTNFADYLRYGSAVTRVNGIGPDELIEWQNWAFVRIYSAPWRWLPVIKKHGIVGFLMQMLRVLRLWRKIAMKDWGLGRWLRFRPVMRHPKET